MKLKYFLFDDWLEIEIAKRNERFVNKHIDDTLMHTLTVNHITGIMEINEAIDSIKRYAINGE